MSITVLIPAYNAAAYLGEALDSLLRQTRPPDEILIVDDGSSDATPEIARSYGGRVTLLQQNRRGPGAARNLGMRTAKGDYIAFLDADDVCAPERLERQLEALQRSPAAVVCFTGHYIFEGDQRLHDYPVVPAAPGTDSLDYLTTCIFVGATAMFDRRRAEGLAFPEHMKAPGEDMIFNALLATRGEVVCVRETLYGYRAHSSQSSVEYRAGATTNPFFEYRLNWAKAHWQEHWPDLGWPEVERRLWRGLVQQTIDAYWTRKKGYFLHDRNYMRRTWPESVPRHEVLSWRWYPDWVWQLKGTLDRVRKP